jgi:hypothetical protein
MLGYQELPKGAVGCGLAGATEAWARSAIGLAQRVAEVMASEPESV